MKADLALKLMGYQFGPYTYLLEFANGKKPSRRVRVLTTYDDQAVIRDVEGDSRLEIIRDAWDGEHDYWVFAHGDPTETFTLVMYDPRIRRDLRYFRTWTPPLQHAILIEQEMLAREELKVSHDYTVVKVTFQKRPKSWFEDIIIDPEAETIHGTLVQADGDNFYFSTHPSNIPLALEWDPSHSNRTRAVIAFADTDDYKNRTCYAFVSDEVADARWAKK